MPNFFIKNLFSFYIWYELKSPLKKGNAFFGRLIRNINPIKYQINGLLLKLNPVSYIDFHLIAYKTHDEEIRNWLDQYLKPDDLFLDIGANIGYFSLYAAKIRNANVIAFEPSKRELSRFYDNISLNQVNTITVYPFALGSETSTLHLNIANFQNPGKNSIVHTDVNETATQECINVTALGDVVPLALIKKIKLIKIDVEGFEYHVLKGMESLMEHLLDVIFIIEITTFIAQDPDLTQTHSIYNFFTSFNFKAHVGIKLNSQYNEVFRKG